MSEKETNQEQESQVAKLDDLPVAQSGQDGVTGGQAALNKSTPKIFLCSATGSL